MTDSTIERQEGTRTKKSIAPAPAAGRSLAAGKYWYTVIDGWNVRMPILSLDPFIIDREKIERYDEPPLTGDYQSHVAVRHCRTKSRKAIHEVLLLDSRISGSQYARSGLINDVMNTCRVSRGNARVLIHRARRLIDANTSQRQAHS